MDTETLKKKWDNRVNGTHSSLYFWIFSGSVSCMCLLNWSLTMMTRSSVLCCCRFIFKKKWDLSVFYIQQKRHPFEFFKQSIQTAFSLIIENQKNYCSCLRSQKWESRSVKLTAEQHKKRNIIRAEC